MAGMAEEEDEQSIVNAGERAGELHGETLGEEEGEILGFKNGSEIGRELGELKGFCIAWKHLIAGNHKAAKKIEELEVLVDSSSSKIIANDKGEDFLKTLSILRSKLKVVKSLLKLSGPERNNDLAF